jgi:hypothetical protein
VWLLARKDIEVLVAAVDDDFGRFEAVLMTFLVFHHARLLRLIEVSWN